MTHKKRALFLCITCIFFSFFAYAKNREHPLVITIPSYNNEKLIQKNLDSVYNQNYDNYRVIYINDASTDNTGKLVDQYVKQLGQEHRTTIIHNKENMGATYNHYMAGHMCQDHEIIVNLDGDDWFKHSDVLNKVNEVYQDKNIWLTYGQFERLWYDPKKQKCYTKKGECKPIQDCFIKLNQYRQMHWLTSHLRTFYAGLYKQIKLKDLLHNGTFMPVTADMAMMYPMLEMSGGKFTCIDEILYVLNRTNAQSVWCTKSKLQRNLDNFIRSRERYTKLKNQKLPFSLSTKKKQMGSLIIIADDTLDYITTQLESISCYATGINTIYILYPSSGSGQKDHEILEKLTHKYSNIKLVKYNENNFKKMFERTIKIAPGQHIILAKQNNLFKDFVNIQKCIELLESTYAHGFYLSLGRNITQNENLTTPQTIPVHTELKICKPHPAGCGLENPYFWQFKMGQHDWKKPYKFYMTLYRKHDILETIQDLNYNSCAELTRIWNLQPFDMNNIGLFFKSSKAFALNNTEKLKNLNLDATKLFLIKNPSTLLRMSGGDKRREP